MATGCWEAASGAEAMSLSLAEAMSLSLAHFACRAYSFCAPSWLTPISFRGLFKFTHPLKPAKDSPPLPSVPPPPDSGRP
jgi:hypothetical protein